MILDAQHITLTIGQSAILQAVNFKLQPGELVGLIGPNGAGKTSLLRILANLQAADSGSVTLDGQALASENPRELAKKMAYLAQGAPTHWPLAVQRIVELGRLPHLGPWSSLSHQDRISIDKAMERAEVSHLADRTVTTLSGGERLRVLIARIFAGEPQIILADEPIASLDPYHQLHVMELLREHCEQGGSAIVVLHDLNMAARFCHRLALLQRGRIIAQGNARSVLTAHNLAAVYGIDSVQLEQGDSVYIVAKRRSAAATSTTAQP